ncbi:HlyD family efflux transporter periplasmic adaptor subunit [Paraflavisolibacter sp. H34]|uniref:HlyD family efflux transporter periplasmic adaptor subunit n=1 Tax=Huijunlia imazamoxiresistens TaxID=3127457 RepID=UPI003018D460
MSQPNNHAALPSEAPLNGYPANPPVYELHSSEVQDIMGRMPHWLVRRGTALLFGAMLLLLAGAWAIHYPDVLVTPVSITSANPPLKVVAASGGRLQEIFVRNNQRVGKGQALCLLQNGARYNDVVLVKDLLYRLDTALELAASLDAVALPKQVQLGELQAGYVDLYQSRHQYRFFRRKDFLARKVGQLQAQLHYQAQLRQELQQKEALQRQQLALEKQKYRADSTLVRDRIIAPLEFDNSKKELISRQLTADETRSGLLHNQVQQVEYLKNITELQQQQLQQENDLQQKVREAVKRLQGQLELWEQKYLLRSPVEGVVSFFRFWKENQYVTAGEAVLVVTPPVQGFVARSPLPLGGAGKVQAGQPVLIKLAAYPFPEFGLVRGRVKTLSAVALDTAYALEVELVNGLMTTTGRQLPHRPELQGRAEILTTDKRILERLFEKLWAGKR